MPRPDTVIRLNPKEGGALWDQAYTALRSALLAGRYGPGDKILLRNTADELGISLTPVRDAVNRLVAERALERGSVGQGGGATVPLLRPEQFIQLMSVRLALEPMATAMAAERASAENLQDIGNELSRMKTSVEQRHLDGYLEAHHRFHFGIYRLAQAPIILEIIESVWLRCGPTLTLALPSTIPSLKRYPHHAKALLALRDQDAAGASDAIRDDILNARDEIAQELDRLHRAMT
jgi:DNA-binding GntR family transcriptional regulator